MIKIGETVFGFTLIFLPLILGIIHVYLKKHKDKAAIFLNYYIFIGVGIQGLLTGIVQILVPQFVVSYLQWQASFLLELGMANISYGILGILSLWMGKGWKMATALGYGLFLIFTGVGHVVDILIQGFTPGNSGAFLYSDFLVGAALLILCLLEQKKSSYEKVDN